MGRNPYSACLAGVLARGDAGLRGLGPAQPASAFQCRPQAVGSTRRRGIRGGRVKILHTSDWHVGKVLKGRDRYDEHAAVLGSITRIARDEDVDVVLVAGDLFETAAPTAKSQGLVMRTL